MTCFVIACPDLKASDYSWIQAIRRRYDPQFNLVAPHFTLVFGIRDIDQESLVEHVTNTVCHQQPMNYVLRCATVVKDTFSPLTHVFLVPDKGYSDLVKLRDALYTGILSSALRLDIPYIPHITIAGDNKVDACKRLADELNRENFTIAGRIGQLDVVQVVRGQLETVGVVRLGG